MNYRLTTAFLLSLFFFLLASFRPVDFAHDTDLYLRVFENYFLEDGERFSEVVFGSVAAGLAVFFNEIPQGREIGGRFFLVVIALIEGILFFHILKRKSPIEAVITAWGFGPLMMLDVIRQGLAMLLAGNFFSAKKPRLIFLIGAFATHIVAVVSLLRIRLERGQVKYAVIAFGLSLLLAFALMEALQGRYEYYVRIGYFFELGDGDVSMGNFSIANIVVVLFILFGAAIKGFSRTEAIILLCLYLSSIVVPLLFRVYFFYFFVVACSRDMLMKGDRLSHILFNIGYSVILFRFSLNAFDWFEHRD